jgi:hypothetical protein
MSLESARARLAATTPGPWLKVGATDGDFGVLGADRAASPTSFVTPAVVSAFDGAGIHLESDANFITHAPTDLAAAIDVIEAAKALRQWSSPRGQERVDSKWGEVWHVWLRDLDRLSDALAAFEALS